MKAARKQLAFRTDPWMGVREAARELEIAPQTVYARALRGELETQVVAGRTVVSRDSVEQLKTARKLAIVPAEDGASV